MLRKGQLVETGSREGKCRGIIISDTPRIADSGGAIYHVLWFKYPTEPAWYHEHFIRPLSTGEGEKGNKVG